MRPYNNPNYDPNFVPGVQPDTLPLPPSPYGNWTAGTPPPPTGGSGQPPRYKPPARRSVGVISAIVLVALAIGGLVLAYPSIFATAKAPVTVTITATTAPTATGIATATLTPSPAPTATVVPTVTNTPTPTATTMPTPIGFQSYISGNGWSIGYPANATYAAGSVGVQGVSIPDVRFDLGDSAQLTVYDSPLAVSTIAAQQIFAAALAAGGATHVTTIDPPAPATIGTVTWLRTKASATLNGQTILVVALYVTHGNGAIAIAYSAPATTFGTIEAQTCLPMIHTFMFAQ